jgi:large subunit ribosomal protein LP1
LTKIIKASGNEVEPYWPMLFAKALKGQDVGALLSNIGTAGPAAGPAAAAGPADAGPAAEDKKEEKKEEAEDVDMGGLFGDDEDDY